MKISLEVFTFFVTFEFLLFNLICKQIFLALFRKNVFVFITTTNCLFHCVAVTQSFRPSVSQSYGKSFHHSTNGWVSYCSEIVKRFIRVMLAVKNIYTFLYWILFLFLFFPVFYFRILLVWNATNKFFTNKKSHDV